MTGPNTLGDAIARLRGRAGLSQRSLATRAGVSIDLIRKLEQGQRRSTSLPTVQAIARALDVDAGALLDKPSPLPNSGPVTGAVAIRRALTSVDDLLGVDDQVEPWSLPRARRMVEHLWAAYWFGHYEVLGRMLPSSIAQARAMVGDVAADDRPEAHDLASQIYQLGACTLVHLGYGDVSHLALREALRFADQGHDPLRPVALRGTMSWLLLTTGRPDEAEQLARRTAEDVGPRDVDPAASTLYGSLLLTSANAAGRAGRRDSAQPYLREATEVAERTGSRNDYQVAFGPDQVRMQTVDVDVVTDAFPEALTTGATMPPRPDLPLAARSRHMSDLALAHLRLGHDVSAVELLARIERDAPTWLSFQAQPRLILQELMRRSSGSERVAALADRAGLTAPE